MQSTFKSQSIGAAIALIFGFLGAGLWSFSGLGNAQTKEYLIENPQILPEMAEAYQRNEAAIRLAGVADQVTAPFPGAILGNPEGSKVLVEFSDYNCGYCRQSLADVEKLIADDPELKVVMREFPIFNGSDLAARMALAAAKQGKYAEFHRAMYERAPATPESINAAAVSVGMDMEQALRDGTSEEVNLELARTQALAQQLGFGGTPSWVTGEQAFEGAVGYSGLKAAIDRTEG